MDSTLEEDVRSRRRQRVEDLDRGFLLMFQAEARDVAVELKEFFMLRSEQLKKEVDTLSELRIEELHIKFQGILDQPNVLETVQQELDAVKREFEEMFRFRIQELREDINNLSNRRLEELSGKYNRLLDQISQLYTVSNASLDNLQPERGSTTSPSAGNNVSGSEAMLFICKRESSPAESSLANMASAITCYKCGMNGHVSSACSKKKPICYNCNKGGHISAHCYKAQKPSTRVARCRDRLGMRSARYEREQLAARAKRPSDSDSDAESSPSSARSSSAASSGCAPYVDHHLN